MSDSSERRFDEVECVIDHHFYLWARRRLIVAGRGYLDSLVFRARQEVHASPELSDYTIVAAGASIHLVPMGLARTGPHRASWSSTTMHPMAYKLLRRRAMNPLARSGVGQAARSVQRSGGS